MADRTYLPWTDAIELMRQDTIPLFALESKKDVKDFDVLGITLQSELTYTNILELLDLSGIPLHAEERDDKQPLVIGGGPCASNPLPLSPFFDAILIGEGEEVIEEIAEVIKSEKYIKPNNNSTDKRRFLSREEVLRKLSVIKGLYVPLIHDECIAKDKDFRIEIRKYSGFSDNTKTHTPQLMSWQMATHNRYVAEIMRGCTRGCRFCLAGYFYRPVRERSPVDILNDLLSEIEEYGWEEAGLSSLSSSDYTCIRPLLEALLIRVNHQKTHISLPSLRVDSFDDTLVNLLRKVGREGLTIAPEAGTQRLRNVINKNLTESEVLAGVQIAKELGWQRIKLYFMIGLPTETDEDIVGIINLIETIAKISGKSFIINVSLSPFVPKAHTPFQWEPMLSPEEILRRILLIKHSLKRYKNIKIRYHTVESSLLEAVISRGDTSSAYWIEKAWQMGAKYDGWNEGFDWDIWTNAASEVSFDINYVMRGFTTKQLLPWDFIYLGVNKEWHIQEREKAMSELTTDDCRNGCIDCGTCINGLQMSLTKNDNILGSMYENPSLSSQQIQSVNKQKFVTNWHYRIIYQKSRDFCFIGHLDWMRMVYRMLGRINLKIVYTQGYNPHPKVSFGPALAVGIIGENEYFDVFTSERYNTIELENALSSFFIRGLKLKAVVFISHNEKITQPLIDELKVIIPVQYTKRVLLKIDEYNSKAAIWFNKQTKEKTKTYNLKEVIVKLIYDEGCIYISKLLQSPNIYDLLSIVLDVPKSDLHNWQIVRTGFID